MNFFSVFESVKSKLLVLLLRLKFVFVEIDCLCLFAVKSFELASGLKLFEGGHSLVSSSFVLKGMFVDSSVDRNFWSVVRSWPYLWFN